MPGVDRPAHTHQLLSWMEDCVVVGTFRESRALLLLTFDMTSVRLKKPLIKTGHFYCEMMIFPHCLIALQTK